MEFFTTLVFLIYIYPLYISGQTDTNYTLTFNFNDHQIKEINNKISIKPVGITLTEDRFGNKQSAIYLHGDASSYLNLGTSNLLKPKKGTISIWVNLNRRLYIGKGYESNPILITKNGPGEDFINAYSVAYDCYSKRLGVSSTKDSTQEAVAAANDTTTFGKWYHLVVTYDNNYLAFYLNGKLQQKAIKNFETKFLKTDSVVVGNMASKKNDRWSEGTFDDIQVFHRVLNEKEVKELYEMPNPNRAKIILNGVLFGIGIIMFILLAAYLLVANRRKSLKREEEKLKLDRKFYEMETKVIKAQMNPHFMFNALNTIQQFIITNENDKAQYYLSKFSRLIRKLLESTTKDNVSLADEIELLAKYLEIESLRFNDVFKYTIEVSEKIDVTKVFIPHFLVQPFIENAIWHGLLPKEGDRRLTIYFDLTDNSRIACTIDDNGIGREKSGMKHHLEKESLAINFVRQRLDLLNKNLQLDLILNIIDKFDKEGNSEGTRVIIMLPIIKNN